MAVLHPAVSERRFPELVESLQEAAPDHESWSLEYYEHPFIAVHVHNLEGAPALGILLDASDWPHRPPAYIPFNLSFKRRLAVEEIESREDELGQRHVVATNGRVWFCVQGTQQFHRHYGDILPWEEIRHLETASPKRVFLECIRCLDREGLNPIQ